MRMYFWQQNVSYCISVESTCENTRSLAAVRVSSWD